MHLTLTKAGSPTSFPSTEKISVLPEDNDDNDDPSTGESGSGPDEAPPFPINSTCRWPEE